MNTTTDAAALTYETTECSRCGGRGRLPEFAHVAGGVCVKCSGSKRQLSRRGAAAQRAYEALMSERTGRSTAEVKVGDRLVVSWDTRPFLVEEIIPAGADGVIYFRRGDLRVGTGPRRRHRLYLPEVAAQAAREIASAHPGATLAGA